MAPQPQIVWNEYYLNLELESENMFLELVLKEKFVISVTSVLKKRRYQYICKTIRKEVLLIWFTTKRNNLKLFLKCMYL